MEEIPHLQRSTSVRCIARVIITYTPSTRIACETHAMSRREVYCPFSPGSANTSVIYLKRYEVFLK
jgi:hypothetical protein